MFYKYKNIRLVFLLLSIFCLREAETIPFCDTLLVGQFDCDYQNIDPKTQELR